MDDSTEDDAFKWFGEGFDGFPKRLPDDCVEYTIHVIDSKLQTAAATRTRLNQILKASNDLKTRLLKDYIWQREPFDLKLIPQHPPQTLDSSNFPSIDNPKTPIPHLHGRTNFGDSVADEWLIVYLLLTLSKDFPSSAWIQIHDTDGEFLLIEAAAALPKWLNPGIAENRVWISNGHLRLIPLADDNDDTTTSRNPSLQEALAFISTQAEKMLISPFIEDEAFFRMRDYPAAIPSSLHHALITVPRRLAAILHRNPTYISPAIEAFYLRDPVSLRPLNTATALHLPPSDFVTVSAKFTKIGYAQLRGQVFDPPPSWAAVVGSSRVGDVKWEVGMKVTVGFEMLLADHHHRRRRQMGDRERRVVEEIGVLLAEVESGEVLLPTDAEMEVWEKRVDGEEWLDIDYRDFEDELSGKGNSKPRGEGDGDGDGKGFGDASAQENLRKMVSRFEDFLNDDKAGAEGIDDDDDMDEDDDSSSNSGSDSGEDKTAANFDDTEFEKAMEEMMGMPADYIEASGLLDEARRLAVEDSAVDEGEDRDGGVDREGKDEDEEMKKVMEVMEKELKGYGALDLRDGVVRKKMKKKDTVPEAKAKTMTMDESGGIEKEKGNSKPFFGPERPPGMQIQVKKRRISVESEIADEEIGVGPGDVELSSDDDEEYNDVDLGLAKNMLESFKGQAGMAGPAGNLMKALGVGMPRDEGDG